ncbi:hypothetical protein TNCV_2205931 [Trichonephila clavipes]|nr:hypothetical protein TNCV_2205931 [Trichonephila clavipes]
MEIECSLGGPVTIDLRTGTDPRVRNHCVSCGSPVVKSSDHGRWPACHEFELQCRRRPIVLSSGAHRGFLGVRTPKTLDLFSD